MNLLNAKSVLLGVTSLWWFLLDKDDWSHKNKHSLYKILQPSSKSCFILKPTLHYFSYCFLAFVAEIKSFICSAFALPTTVARDWNKMYIIYQYLRANVITYYDQKLQQYRHPKFNIKNLKTMYCSCATYSLHNKVFENNSNQTNKWSCNLLQLKLYRFVQYLKTKMEKVLS